MIVLRRLSSGATIPEMMRAETDVWLSTCWDRVRPSCSIAEVKICFALATLVLVAARLLLWLRLVEPRFAVGSLVIATCLSSRGMRSWRRYRRDIAKLP